MPTKRLGRRDGGPQLQSEADSRAKVASLPACMAPTTWGPTLDSAHPLALLFPQLREHAISASALGNRCFHLSHRAYPVGHSFTFTLKLVLPGYNSSRPTGPLSDSYVTNYSRSRSECRLVYLGFHRRPGVKRLAHASLPLFPLAIQRGALPALDTGAAKLPPQRKPG